jgi:hypothetical protein
MADTINYGRSGRGAKDPRKTLTPAQRRRESMARKAKDAGSRKTTAEGAVGAMLAITPIGMAKAFLVPANVAKSLISKGVARTASKVAAKKATKAPNKLVQQLQKNEAAAGKMYKGPAKVKKPMSRPEKVARVAAGQGTKGRRSGTALRDKKTGKLTGVKDKDARLGKGIRDMAGPAARGAGVAAASASAASSKKKADKPLSKLPTKTVATRKKPVPVDDTPRPKRKPAVPAAKKKGPVQGPKNKPLKALEGGVRYVDNPFGKGKIKMDTSQKGMFPDEMEFDYAGGRVGKGKKSPRKRIGRGCGAAIKGGGKVMR